MSNRELLDGIRAVLVELERLIESADFNSGNANYDTKIRLERAQSEVAIAERHQTYYVEAE